MCSQRLCAAGTVFLCPVYHLYGTERLIICTLKDVEDDWRERMSRVPEIVIWEEKTRPWWAE